MLNHSFKLYESLITFSFSTGFLFGKKKKCCVRGGYKRRNRMETQRILVTGGAGFIFWDKLSARVEK